MAKSQRREADRVMAEEMGLELSPFVLTLKHIVKLKSPEGGLCFTYQHNSQYWYDIARVHSQTLGRRKKLFTFLMPELVAKRLSMNHYRSWYFYDTDYLYPLSACKVGKLFDALLIRKIDDPHYRPSVIVDPDGFNLRKKPLVAVRQTPLTWDDCVTLPSHTPKSTQPVLRECYA